MIINIFSERNRASEALSEELSARGEQCIFVAGDRGFAADALSEYASGADASGEADDDEVRLFLIKEDERENLSDALLVKDSAETISAAAAAAAVRLFVFSSSEVTAYCA